MNKALVQQLAVLSRQQWEACEQVKAAINALATLPSISPDDVRNVAFHNAVRVYGLDTEKLKKDVEKIGFELA